MNIINRSLLICILIVIESGYALEGDKYVQYSYPKDGSKYVSCQTDLIIRFHSKWLNYLNTQSILIEVNGSLSGPHTGNIIQTSDKYTYIFKPDRVFQPNEVVRVKIWFLISGEENLVNFEFFTSAITQYQLTELPNNMRPSVENTVIATPTVDDEMTVINGISVPSDFPEIEIDILEETDEGMIFLSNFGSSPYLMILHNDGTPYFYQRLPGESGDFKVQPTGTLTQVGWPRSLGFFEMNSNYVVVDTLACGNGYLTDTHDVQVLSNGNYLLIALDYQSIDMSQYIEGGDPSATVIGNHIQEIDRHGNVVFEWRSWDHFDITDAIHVDLTANTIDYVHMNSIAVDYDNHLIVSNRHLSEITKINRQTGEIIWRLGGQNSQFDFVHDIYGISYQHDVRPVPQKNNHYTIFDNGNFRDPLFSRVVEFYIDTTNMTATNVWEYRHTPDYYAGSRGSVQRLENGNTLIDWSGGALPVVTEVTGDGEIVYDMRFKAESRTYRTFRFDWEGILEKPYLIAENRPDKVSLIFNKFGDDDLTGYIIYADTLPNPRTSIDTTINTWLDLSDLRNYTEYYFQVTALYSNGEESDFSNQESVFVRYLEPGENLILNGDFIQNTDYWQITTHNNTEAGSTIENNECHLNIENAGSGFEDIQFIQSDILVESSKRYVFEFDAFAENDRIINPNIEQSVPPFENYSKIGSMIVTTERTHYRFEFDMENTTDYNARVVFNIGGNMNDVFLDNVSLREIDPSIVMDKDDNIPGTFSLSKNYPNPFNPRTVIGYRLSAVSNVVLNIYNILGEEVAVLVSEKQAAGSYQVEWDASDYASGIYYYRLKTNAGFVQTKKLILLK